MKPFGQLVPLETAVELAVRAARPVETVEQVSLQDALERVLALDVVAGIDVPGTDKCAMDGYAVRSADTGPGGAALRLRGVAYPGEPFGGAVGAGTCVRVATGAPLPQGCDAVVPFEDAGATHDAVRLSEAVKPGQHVVRRGDDVRVGTTVIRRGSRLRPAQLGALAGIGMHECAVYTKPRVAIIPTGREVRRRGPLGPGDVFDSNSFALAALVQDNGGAASVFEPVADDHKAIEAALARTDAFDLILVSGSTSVGERDHLERVVADAGEVVYHGVAVKPGKPLLFGRIARTLVFGLPGYPASCMLVAYHVVRPVLRTMARWTRVVGCATAMLADDLAAPKDKTLLAPVLVHDGRATPTYRGSAATTGVSRASGYVVVPPGASIEPGATVAVALF